MYDHLLDIGVSKIILCHWYESWLCRWFAFGWPFYRFAKPSYASFSNSTHPFLPLAIESRHGSMTRDDSSARMRPVIAMWYKIRTANRDEENSPDERWTVVLCDLSIEHHRGAPSTFFKSLYADDASMWSQIDISIKNNLLWIKKYNL